MKLDRNMLETLYHDENLTLDKIGKMYNRSGPTISYYIKKWNISPKKKSRYGKNFSHDLLHNLYIVQDLKVAEIAELLNSNSITVAKYLKQFGIKIKGIKHYNKHPPVIFTKEQYDFFDGLMASDGSLVIGMSEGRVRNAKISCGFKYRRFAEYIDRYLDLDGNIHKKVHKSTRYKKGYCVQYGLMSKNNTVFTEEHRRWYPSGKKIIPNDFRFSPISMNIMYLGDGHLDKTNKYIVLSTQSFDKNNIERTIIKGLIGVGIECHVTPANTVLIPKYYVPDFLDYIGKCPIDCYSYKWGF